MATLELSFASGESSLSVRRFVAREQASDLFAIEVEAGSVDAAIDIGALTGQGVALSVDMGELAGGPRSWTGICRRVTQVQAESTGESRYRLTIVPRLWLATQRRGYRIFQQQSLVAIVTTLLDEWRVNHRWAIDEPCYPPLDLKVQYDETDYAFICRLLEEAGIAFFFSFDGERTLLLLHDDPCAEQPRDHETIPYTDAPNESAGKEFVTKVALEKEVRPGAYAVRDVEFRAPGFTLLGQAHEAAAAERAYEQFDYHPGSFLVEGNTPGQTPHADDRGVARHSLEHGRRRAAQALAAIRTGNHRVVFTTNVVDLWPGRLFSIDHPHEELRPGARLMAVEQRFEGSPNEAWTITGKAVFARQPYRPARRTPVPEVSNVQSATVVGPAGEEIHTDEHGRVRVQFPWDRQGASDERSSCWLRVSQPWAGTGYGSVDLPRVGHEVLVAFEGGNPDRPLVVGRVFNQQAAVPYRLPRDMRIESWKSDSSLGSGGDNEIRFEDVAGQELVYLQAEKNGRKLVKGDEITTVGRDRHRLVERDEQDTTDGNRTEVTDGDRYESTAGQRHVGIQRSREGRVHGDENRRTLGALQVFVGGDQDVVVEGVSKQHVAGDAHLKVLGERRQKVDGSQSLFVGGSQQERIRGRHAVEVGLHMHLRAGAQMVLDGVRDVSLKAPGGFLRVSEEGIVIEGEVVKINSGGSPGNGAGAMPQPALDAREMTLQSPAVEVAALLDVARAHGVRVPIPLDWSTLYATARDVAASTLAQATTALADQGRAPGQIRELVASSARIVPHRFVQGETLYTLVPRAGVGDARESLHWIAAAAIEPVAAEQELRSRAGRARLAEMLSLPESAGEGQLVATTVLSDHDGVASAPAERDPGHPMRLTPSPRRIAPPKVVQG